MREHKTISDIIKSLPEGIERIVLTYDGSGDSGDVDTCVAYGTKDTILPENIENDLSEFAYDLLKKKHPGWEINEGSHGTITISTESRNVKIVHNEHYQYEDTSESEEDF